MKQNTMGSSKTTSLAATLFMLGTAAFAAPVTVELILMHPIPSDTPGGNSVELMQPGANGCRFKGTLEKSARKDEGMLDKVISHAHGDSSRYMVVIATKVCGDGAYGPVSFTIELGRNRPGPDTGTRFFAVAAQ